jgi:hypothetical protein
LAACGPDDEDTGEPDTETGVPCTVDADEDGACAEEDCDDTNALVAPGKPDIPYNGRDEDCDGSDLNDVDKDGYVGERAGGDDCNDANPDINPGAPEICYGDLDMNCDGYIPVDDCDQDGFVRRADCNDENPDIFPAATEVPYDGVDQDCSYTSDFDVDVDGDEIPWDASWPPASWPEEIIVWNKDEPGKFKYIKKADAQAYWTGLDCNDKDVTIGGNLRERWDGVDRNCDTIIDQLHERDALTQWQGNAGVTDFSFGSSLALIPDIDGDGAPEVAVGDVYHNTAVGKVYLIPSNKPTGKGFEQAMATVGDPDGVSVLMGIDVESLGDLDGDGLGDLAIGNPYLDGEGAVLVYLGKDLKKGGDFSFADAHARATVGFQSGSVIANLGDLDGDGLPEVGTTEAWVSLLNDGGGDTNLGIWSGKTLAGGGTLGVGRVMALVTGSKPSGELAGGVDLDGDGEKEVVLGEFGGLLNPEDGPSICASGTGRVYFTGASALTGGRILTVGDLDAMTGGACFGFSLGLADDFDEDGYGELVVADPGVEALDGGVNGGQVYVIPGNKVTDGADGTSLASFSVRARKANTWLRVEDRFADHDADGVEDLVVGAPGILDVVMAKLEWIPPAGDGYTYVFESEKVASGGTLDGNASDARFLHRSTGSGMGASWAAGDVNADGRADLVLGAPTIGVGGVFTYLSALVAE